MSPDVMLWLTLNLCFSVRCTAVHTSAIRGHCACGWGLNSTMASRVASLRPLLSGWVAVYKPRGVFSMGPCRPYTCDPAARSARTLLTRTTSTRAVCGLIHCRLRRGCDEGDWCEQGGALWDAGRARRRCAAAQGTIATQAEHRRRLTAARRCYRCVQACSPLRWVGRRGSSNTSQIRRCTKRPSSSARAPRPTT